MKSSRRVLITGIGVLSAGASSPGGLEEALGGGAFPAPAEITAFEVPEGSPEKAHELADFSVSRYVESIKSYIDRTSALAVAAAKLALDDAGLAASRPEETGLAYGTAWGCLDSMELFFHKVKLAKAHLAPPLPFSHSYANSPAAVLAIEFGLRGFHTVVSSGWNSSAVAVGEGLDAVRAGASPVVLAGGSESGSHARYRHLLDSGLIGEGRAVLGEGACFVVLEGAESAAKRGGRPLAEALGRGASGERSPAEAAARAVSAACRDAGVEPKELAAVACRSSGLAEIDDAEVAGISRACGISAAEARERSVSAYGACGLVEGAAGAFASALAALAARRLGRPTAALTLDPGGSAAAVVLGPAR
jgi:3-oxoacyl-(acyl-carrier-protein) synthase